MTNPKRESWNMSTMAVRNVLEPLRKRVGSPRTVTVFKDDVFIVSYPKSGNTWCRFLVGNLLSNDMGVSFANVEARIPDIYRHSNNYLLKIPRPRVLKSHEYFIPDYRKVIYVIRDPRAVAVSYYHYLQDYTGNHSVGDLTSFVDAFLDGKLDSYGAWGQHVGSWYWEISNNKHVLLLKYEDILNDAEQELRKLATFLGVNVANEKITKVIQTSSFDQMQVLEQLEPGHLIKVRGCKSRNDAAFVREGKARGWKSELSNADRKRIEIAWGELMRTFGYL